MRAIVWFISMANQYNLDTKYSSVFITRKTRHTEIASNTYLHMLTMLWFSKSVQIGDIDPNLKTETLRQKIRDEYLRDSTVTVVLIGAETWKRKHVDWEIGASIRQTEYSPRSGLIGIILPAYPRLDQTKYDPYTIPPRLYDNIKCRFAEIYNWSEDLTDVQKWIHEAFERRNSVNPNNSFPLFTNNRSGDRWQP